MTVDWGKFAERVEAARQTWRRAQPRGGTSGVELEVNVLDGALRPVEWVGSGPGRSTVADALKERWVPEWARGRLQLEVFAWMAEAATRPHHDPWNTAAEGRLLEAVFWNSLGELGTAHGGCLLPFHGPLLGPVTPGPEAVPAGWNLAHRRYLQRCVELFGSRLATAGVHTNHSLPDPLLEWDFLHLPAHDRRGLDLERFRSQAMIRLTRVLRAWCPVFIAVSAASPLGWEMVNGERRIVLTGEDSRRVLTFPNPAELDVPGLYASHAEYLRISYDLVRRGIRFGANNWTPVRARSGVEPVLRNIQTTAEQLHELYRRGLYAPGQNGSLEEAERELLVENLCARVDLPMSRVEVRTDEGGDDFDLAVAKVAFKELLALRAYADPEWCGEYRYGAEDVERARANELAAARRGLDAVVRHPLGGRRATVRELLGELLEEVRPLAEALGAAAELDPLVEMAAGGPNPAGAMRRWLQERLGASPEPAPSGLPLVPVELVLEWADRRRRALAGEVAGIAGSPRADEGVRELAEHLRRWSAEVPGLPVPLEPGSDRPLPAVAGVPDRVRDTVALAARLVAIPSVTNCPEERLEEVHACARFIAGHLGESGAEVQLYAEGRYPAVVAGFPGAMLGPVVLAGHFDVVPPEPGADQFSPRVEGDFLWGRGAADMKTVVASWLVWFRERLRMGPPYPPFTLLLVGNEENGEQEAWGTPHVLRDLGRRRGWEPEILLVGERTGERGDELFGSVCTANRGIARLRIIARGRRAHTGTGDEPRDLLDRLVAIREAVRDLLPRHLTLASFDGWHSTARFPFLWAGEPGVYNITADRGELGLEVRPIPDDDLQGLVASIRSACEESGLETEVEVLERGIACPPDHPVLCELVAAVEAVSGEPAPMGRKLAGTSARFAPGGRAVVWGQSGIGPHSAEERHFIPSIGPYLEVLDELAGRLMEGRAHSRGA